MGKFALIVLACALFVCAYAAPAPHEHDGNERGETMITGRSRFKRGSSGSKHKGDDNQGGNRSHRKGFSFNTSVDAEAGVHSSYTKPNVGAKCHLGVNCQGETYGESKNSNNRPNNRNKDQNNRNKGQNNRNKGQNNHNNNGNQNNRGHNNRGEYY